MDGVRANALEHLLGYLERDVAFTNPTKEQAR
jgi:hypothetical protein